MPAFFRRKPRHFRHHAHFENVLGTSLEIQLIGETPQCGAHAETAILAEIDRLSAIFNAYHSGSELSRWQLSSEAEVAVSSELASVLHLAEEWRKTTQGAFNPASEAFSRVWKKAESENRKADAHELETLSARINGPLWEVDLARKVARRLTQLPATLNSIAKGFIIDRAAEVGGGIKGISQLIVNIGGDIRHFGNRETAITIANPRADAENAPPLARLQIRNQGVATSGDYRRGFSVEGHWFSHLIDPRSGAPVRDAIGVSVLAPDAMRADILATACSVLGIEAALKLADSLPEIGVLIVGSDGAQSCNQFWRAHTNPKHS